MAKQEQSNRSKRASSRRAFSDLKKVLHKQIENALTGAVMTSGGRDGEDFKNQALNAQRMVMDIEKGILDLEKFYDADMMAPMSKKDIAEAKGLHATGMYNLYELADFYDIGFGDMHVHIYSA